MTVSELIRTKRATRQFSQQQVSEEDLSTILNAGRLAPSSENKQPWTFLVIRDRETLQRLAACGEYAAHLLDAAFAIALVATSADDAFDLGQAAAYLQLAAWELGIGSCVLMMDVTEKAKTVLHIPADLHFDLVIDFGYPVPQENPRPLRKNGRKPLDEVVRWEYWS